MAIFLLSLFVLFILIILLRTFLFRPTPTGSAEKAYRDNSVDGEKAAESLSRAISIPTISYMDYESFDYVQFSHFLVFLKERYPLVNSTCSSRIINDYSIVYCWKGRNSELPPILFLGHYDVVPVEKGTGPDWKQPPFSGKIADGYLWGRGALDMKVQIISHMEAAEQLISEGFQPERDIWFSYNFDEEQRGQRGATGAAAFFKELGIRFDMVFDEGGAIVQGALAGVEPPLAMIGLGEKGIANIKITVKGEGGHSSMPPASTALGKLAAVIGEIETHPMAPSFTSPVKEMLKIVGPEMPGFSRLALANMGLFKPLLYKIFSAAPTTNAMIRTSFSATMATAGDAPNVLPQSAEAVINCRLLPGDSGEKVMKHLTDLAHKVCLPEQVTIEPLLLDEASALSPSSSDSYYKIVRSIGKIFPQALVSPYLMMGGSDATKFTSLSDNVYRFMPVLISHEELGTMHNTNERISLENIERSVTFFKYFMARYQ